MKREKRAPKNAAKVPRPESTVGAMIVATFPEWAELESLSARLAAGVRDMKIDVPGDRLAATFQALISILRNSAKRGDNVAVQNLFQAAVATTESLDELAETPIAGPLICELAWTLTRLADVGQSENPPTKNRRENFGKGLSGQARGGKAKHAADCRKH